MKYLILFPVLFIAALVAAQKIPARGNSIQAFVPAGYDTLQTATGDLNKDSINDVVLVLKSKVENEPDSVRVDVDSIPNRMLLVLFNTGTGYALAAKGSNAILCKNCGGMLGDPFAGISIKKGLLIVEHYGGSAWRWGTTHKFRYQQNDFYLIGRTTTSYWDVEYCDKLGEFAATDYKDENLITGDYVEKKVSEEGCKLLLNKKGKQKTAPLIKLSAFVAEN